MRHKGRFVLAVAGQAHVRRAEAAIAFLKRLTRRDILLVTTRGDYRPSHDEVIETPTPPEMTDHQAGIFLKTGLADIVENSQTFCYLDSDVIAVGEDVDTIFSQTSAPIAFAADHAGIDVFSRHAVHCFCAASPCPHLRERMAHDLAIRVTDPEWTMWNGGVFVCRPEGRPFIRLWHELALRVFKNPFWQTRDQAVLAATVWRLGLQDLGVLDPRFNLLVDRFKSIPERERDGLAPAQFSLRTDYRLPTHPGDAGVLQPAFLHFINGGAGQVGWRNWDDVIAHHSRVMAA